MRSSLFRVSSAAVSLTAATVAAVALAAVPPTADAATAAPGAPIRVHSVAPSLPDLPIELDNSSCSQGPVGTVTRADGTQATVMLTAAHCTVGLGDGWEPSGAVFAPKQHGDVLIGHRNVVGFDNPDTGDFVGDTIDLTTGRDWSTVDLLPGVTTSRTTAARDYYGNPSGAPVVLTGVRDYSNLGYREVSVDNFGQPICKDGSTSGRSCGYQLFRTQQSVFSWGLDYANGDSGGINFDPNNGEAIGVTSQGVGPVGRAQTADAALQDAYGIPDGQVNEYFQLAPGTETQDGDFRALVQDDQAANEWINAHYDVPNYTADFQGEVASAQNDAARLSAEVQAGVVSGDFGAAQAAVDEAAQAAQHYSQTLPAYGVGAAIESVGSSH